LNKEDNAMTVDPGTLEAVPTGDDQTCFACGAKNAHGLRMKFYTDHQQLYSFLCLPDTMTGWDRTIHGGVLSTILDEIMGWAVIHLFKKLGVTQSITVDFKRPVKAGEDISVRGGILEVLSERSARMTGTITNANEEICTQAVGQFTLIRPKAAVRLGIVGADYMKTFGPVFNVDDPT
jgi:acyl-coenzyme A thioesterase PaaI-like protein